jgi:alkanesulfonate monooxygenase SsuD/methylene tetrahydromethanopterin reductase-like flavin-dependent oxidoreductase (luciferase family)
LYHTPAGARFANFAESWQKAVLSDATPDGAYNALATILNLNDYIAPRSEAPMAGFKAEYVKQWTANLVADTGKKVYSGIGIGVGDAGASKAITPQEVKDGVNAAYDGGASGVLLSRNYSEAELASLDAVGEALKERGLW